MKKIKYEDLKEGMKIRISIGSYLDPDIFTVTQSQYGHGWVTTTYGRLILRNFPDGLHLVKETKSHLPKWF